MSTLPLIEKQEWTFRRVVWATLVVGAVALCFWLLYRFYLVVFILFISIVLGTVIKPLVNWLNRRGIPRVTGIILIFVFLIVALAGFILLLFPLVVDQGSAISASLPAYYQSLRIWFTNNPYPIMVSLGEFLPPNLPGLSQQQASGQQILATAEQVLGVVNIVGEVLFIAIVIPLLAFYWTLNGERIVQSFLLLLPKKNREGISDLVGLMESKVGSFIIGQGLLCLVIGAMAYVAYLAIGLPNALVLALLAGLFEAVPMIGPLLGAIPASLIALSIAPSKLLWVIAATLLIQQLENNFLVPRVMRKAVGVNPFVSLLSIFAFSTLFGIAGALMAIPLAAIIQLLLDYFVFRPEASETEVPAERDMTSLLRYEAQDLASDLRKQARIKKWGSDRRVKQIDQVMDEIEAIATDLDILLAQVPTAGKP